VQETVSNWPKLLSLAVHEFRTPVTVVSGYIRMLLRDRAGPVPDSQRRLLEEAEKSCGRLSGLLGQMSEIGQLHDGRQALTKAPADLRQMLLELLKNVPIAEGESGIRVESSSTEMVVSADATRLRRSLEDIVYALRREIVDAAELIVNSAERRKNSRRVAWIALGIQPIADALQDASADALGPFDEWRGGCGLALPLARRVIEMHGGRLMALPGERQNAGAVIELPLS
jgi:signal transduction histidine kinase